MEIRPMSEEEVGRDRVRARVRRCGRCKAGRMSCAALTQHRLNNADVGRDYVFRCASCGHEVRDYNATRVQHQVLVLALCGGFGGFLLYLGLPMLLNTLSRGFGGNDASAVIVVLALFLLGGGVLSALALRTAWGLAADWRLRQQSPEITPRALEP
jgi:hypothetical protein